LALEFPRNRFPTELAKVMHNRTEGSPLFVTNLVRYLRDSNSIAEKDGVWTLTQAIPDLERDFPESVRGLIQLNIGRLSDADKRLLVVASVQGAEFDSTIVAEVLRLNAADVEERLQDLDQIYKLVHLVAEADFPDRTVSLRYRFVHILYQNSLYASLTPTRRSSYAAAVAGLIQSHHGKQVSSVASALALLYEAARDFRKASEFFLMAAQNAARLFANKEAATLARRGLSLLRNLPDLENRTPLELGLSLRLGIALMTIKGYADPDVQAAYAKAHQLSQKVGESVQLFPILFGLWLFCLVRVEREMAEELAGRLLRFAESTKDPVLLVQAHSAKGTTEQNIAGEFTNSVEHFKRALEFYDPAQHWTFVLHTGHDLGATAYALMAWSYWCLGETDLALETARTGVRFARERAHPYSITFALTYLGMIQCSRGEFLEGKQTAEEVLRIARDEGAVNFIARGKMMIGFAMVHLEPTDEAIQQIREGLSIYKATGAQLFPWGYILLTEALLYMGRIDEAATTSAEAVETLSRIPVRGYEAEIWRLRGEVLRRMAGNEHEEAAKGALVQEAAEAFRHAIEVAGKQKARRWEEHAKDGLAALYNATS
jgi:tetratricopeptide (TPR) repeat protein